MASKRPREFILDSAGLPDPLRMTNYETTAYKLAQQHCATKLAHKDINHCIMDIIQEKSWVKSGLELSKEFQLYLLDSGCDFSEYLSWRNGEKIPITRSLEIDRYARWLSQPRICSMDKDEKRKELERLHNEKSDQNCTTRIRYLKLKLKLAEKIGLIVNTGPSEFPISS